MATDVANLPQVVLGARHTLTDQQRRLVEVLTADVPKKEADGGKVPKKEAVTPQWELAGYSSRQNFDAACRSPTVQAALLEHRRAQLAGGLAQAALMAIRDLITNDKTPSATRLAASRWVLEQAGHTAQADEGKDVPLHEMTPVQLAAFMERAQRVIDEGGEPPMITVTPDNGA